MIYVISPVRQVTPEQSEEIAKHAALLKETGATVFNPVEDAPQDDATGYNIVMSELNFMYKASKEGGRVDILWNMGGKPSEGSRVDVGIAIALGLKTNLITVFNKDNSTGPQEAYRIIENFNNEIPDLQKMAKKIEEFGRITIDWDIDMINEKQEWQRIYLDIALGVMANNPNFEIKLGELTGIDPPDKKSYPKVIKEIEKKQSQV